MDSKADVGKAFNPEKVTAESLISAAENQPAAAAPAHDQHELPNPETLVPNALTKSPQAAATLEDTRLIPDRPVTPFAATRALDEFIEREDNDLPLSTVPCRDLVSVWERKRHFLKSFSKLCSKMSNLFKVEYLPVSDIQLWTKEKK